MRRITTFFAPVLSANAVIAHIWQAKEGKKAA
jgi:hypothetical protein